MVSYSASIAKIQLVSLGSRSFGLKEVRSHFKKIFNNSKCLSECSDLLYPAVGGFENFTLGFLRKHPEIFEKSCRNIPHPDTPFIKFPE